MADREKREWPKAHAPDLRARVDGKPVIEGTMTFALGPPQGEV